jgi:hypothetical protein
MCTGRCRHPFIISATASRMFVTPEGAESKARAAHKVAGRLPTGRIHVVDWSFSHDDVDLSVGLKNAWMSR